jgi:hypothetical protein
MNKVLIFIIIILLGVIATPYILTHSSTAQQTDMPPGMVMKSFDLGSTMASSSPAAIPTIAVDIKKDSLDGWDLHVITTNYTWTPENINQAPIANQGHAHLYIDGKLIVLLGPWYHIDSALLAPGRHVITVSLNANDHSVFSVNGQNIQATQTLYVSPI